MTRILVLDNYDSFVYTLNGYLQQLGAETDVVRNDAFDAADTADREEAAARAAELDPVTQLFGARLQGARALGNRP